jgi:hypothetical protein
MTRRDDLIKLRDAVRSGVAVPLSFICLDAESHRQAFRAYNGSLDAAMALNEVVLPGWRWQLRHNEYDSTAYIVQRPNSLGSVRTEAKSDTPARAWLLAIIEALIMQEGGE